MTTTRTPYPSAVELAEQHLAQLPESHDWPTAEQHAAHWARLQGAEQHAAAMLREAIVTVSWLACGAALACFAFYYRAEIVGLLYWGLK